MNDLFEDDLEFMTVEELKKEVPWPYDHLTTLKFRPYITRLKPNEKNEYMGIEIGTGRGEGLYYLLDKIPNLYVSTIDPYFPYIDWNGKEYSQEYQNKMKELALKNLEPFGNRATMINLESEEAVDTFKDDNFHFVFIDGKHDTKNVFEDLKNYYSKVMSGGIIAGNGFSINSVWEGIDKFRKENRITTPIHIIDATWFWYK